MQQPYVYLDVVFLINLVMDYTILWATARLGQIEASKKRLLLGALTGASYSAVLLLPGMGFLYSLVFRVLLSLVIVVVAFAPVSVKGFLRLCGYFYLVAFTMGGAMLGAVYLLSSSGTYGAISRIAQRLVQIPYLWLLIALAVAVAMGRWGTVLIRRALTKNFFRVPLTISIEDRSITVPALLDTGNQLKDPLTQSPVVIAEYSVMEPYLPEDLKEILKNSPNFDLKKTAETLADSIWSHRIRLIPFTSIGKNHGMLLGLRPDEVKVTVDERILSTRNVVVGIYDKQLCPQGTYRALVHPELLESAMTA
ncbi:MAG: sigma-E processing peptidase SpoIIGA [Firmicutes bacterium]|nr:sigma-E processing peptidase SpoIIGA [Bacillota bacterium]